MTDKPGYPPARTRLWDKGMNLLYDSDTDSRTPEQYFREEALREANYSIDREDPPSFKTRDSGRLIWSSDGERLIWSPARDWLHRVTVAHNAVMDDPGRFGADINVKEGDKVGFMVGDKMITGKVKRIFDESGSRYIVFEDEPQEFTRAVGTINHARWLGGLNWPAQ